MKNSGRRLGFIRPTDFLLPETTNFCGIPACAQKFVYGSQRAMSEFGKRGLAISAVAMACRADALRGATNSQPRISLSTGSNQALLLIAEIRKCAFLIVVGIEGNVERHHARTQREK